MRAKTPLWTPIWVIINFWSFNPPHRFRKFNDGEGKKRRIFEDGLSVLISTEIHFLKNPSPSSSKFQDRKRA